MNIEESALWDQVLQVVNSPAKPVNKYWEADIHANGLTITPLKVLNIDRVRDFENDFAPEIMIDVMLPMGEYTYLVYPFQDALEITLYASPLNEAGSVPTTAESVVVERFTAVMIDLGNPMMNNSGKNTPTQQTLDLTNTVTVTFQLQTKAIEQMRMRSYGNTFRDQTVEDVLKLVMTVESQKVDVGVDQKPKGVDIVPPSNKEKRSVIAIPQGIPLVDIPNYIHLRQGGVYSGGMGYFYENGYWYMYPCYDTTRFQKAERTLTVINVPTNKLPQTERTYLQNGSSLVIIATGDVKFVDDSTQQQLANGNGVFFTDANKFMEDMGVASGNKLLASRAKVASEFIAATRENGNNYVPRSNAPISGNPYVQFSALARREGSVFGFTWDNSNAGLIFPGMVVKLLYLEEATIKELYGVILKAHEYTELAGQGATTSRHTTRTVVSIFTQRIVDNTGVAA